MTMATMTSLSEQTRQAKALFSYMEICLNVDPTVRKTVTNNKMFHAFLMEMAKEDSATNMATYQAAYDRCAAARQKVLDAQREQKKEQKKRKALHEIIKPNKKSRPQALVADSLYASVSRY